MTRLRRTIAARLKEAQNTAAMLTTFNEVDMSAVMTLRSTFRDAFEKKHGGVRLGFMSLFVKACIAALKEFPAVNAEIDGDDVVYKHFVHMGIAVGGANGLVVPVVRNADQMSVAELERSIADFGRRAHDGLLKLEVCAADVVRVAYAKNKSLFARKSLAAAPKRCDGAKWEVTQEKTDPTKGATTADMLAAPGRRDSAYARADRGEPPQPIDMDIAITQSAKQLRAIIDQYGPRPALPRFADVVVPVTPRRADGDEEVPRFDQS